MAGVASTAQAHTGHGTHSLMEGLVHPFGLDHLLAMVAVGVWSVSALPQGRAWQGPATFLLALVASAVLGAAGLTVPFLEHGVSLSVVLFGAMLLVASRPMPPALGLGLIAVAASLHGLAHGSETPESGFAGYAIGFLVTTAALHTGGVGMGLAIKRWLARHSGVALGGLGAALSAAGLYLFGQLAA
jgi:urease accessory protein